MTLDVRTNADLRGSLGLEDAVFGESQRLPWRPLAEAAPDLLPHPAVDAVGGRLRVEPDNRRLHLEMPADRRWIAHTAPGREDALSLDPQRPQTAVVNAGGRGAVSFALDTGAGLVVEFDGRGVTFTPVANAAPWLDEDDPASPPVAVWASERGDNWLASHLDELLREPTLWHKTLSLGLFVRLREPAQDPQATERLAAALRGEADPHDVEAFRWVRCLRHDLVMAIDDALGECCDRLEQLLAAVEKGTLQRGSADDSPTFPELCQVRDEVAAVVAILDRRAPRGRVRDRLNAIDVRGAAIARQPGAQEVEPSEYLRRAARADALAWWTRRFQPHAGHP